MKGGEMGKTHSQVTLWGSELSPFALKIRSLLEYAQVPYRSLPVGGAWADKAAAGFTIERAKLRHQVIRFPDPSPLDEYPLVPYVIDKEGRVLYDSSAIGRWLDASGAMGTPRLFPEDPAVEFVAQLIDEAFDEFGLYILHHNRWVVSAADNNAGERLSNEFSWLLPWKTKRLFAARFSKRQVRRLPYLFSVAPAGFVVPGVPRNRTPPSRPGFPPTHELLETAWAQYVDVLERILSDRPFLLGGRFTVADASAFGHVGGSFIDPSARRRLELRAPRTYLWLDSIWRGGHVGSRGDVAVDSVVAPLLQIVAQTFLPLMVQNEAAYLAARSKGETLFNERAFNVGRALYDGELLGRPFRSVAKTFQVQTLRELRDAWNRLPRSEQQTIERHAFVPLHLDAVPIPRLPTPRIPS